jgi:hypothetical protein
MPSKAKTYGARFEKIELLICLVSTGGIANFEAFRKRRRAPFRKIATKYRAMQN